MLALALPVMLLLSACSSPGRALRQETDLPAETELASTPFYPQTAHQCGPAALATVLGAAGFSATPASLAPRVYLPGRQGSLALEMIAAARTQGAFTEVVPPNTGALLAEVAAGRPVLVLLNLGLRWAPRWHYAVVVGYDLTRDVVVLRSGVTARERFTLRTFERTWERGGSWGMVVLQRGELPRWADRVRVAEALSQLEPMAEPAYLLAFQETARARWPEEMRFGLGAGTALYRMGRLTEAESTLRQTLLRHPRHAVVLNNLATVLQAQGRLMEAFHAADQAVALGGPWQQHALQTRAEILRHLHRALHPVADASSAPAHLPGN